MKNAFVDAMVRVQMSVSFDDDVDEDSAFDIASNRLYDALYEGLCKRSSDQIDFWIESQEWDIEEA